MNKINWKREARLLPGYLIVGIWVLFTAVMLFWILGASLSTSREIFSGQIFKFESGFHFENYATAWKAQNVSVFFANSLLYSVISCVGVLAIAAPAAYVLSRWKFTGGKALRIGLVIAMSVPVIMVIMPIYSLSVQWGIKGRVLLVILYIMLRVPYTTIYLLDFFSTLSRTYEEAAYLDGCSGPNTLIFTSSESMAPVGVGLLNIINSMKYTGQYGGMFAAVIIVFLPTFLLYIFMSEKIIAGVTGGGVKG